MKKLGKNKQIILWNPSFQISRSIAALFNYVEDILIFGPVVNSGGGIWELELAYLFEDFVLILKKWANDELLD